MKMRKKSFEFGRNRLNRWGWLLNTRSSSACQSI